MARINSAQPTAWVQAGTRVPGNRRPLSLEYINNRHLACTSPRSISHSCSLADLTFPRHVRPDQTRSPVDRCPLGRGSARVRFYHGLPFE